MSPLAASLRRFWGIVTKELVQMRRDRLTFAMMIGIPLLQLTLFGFAINNDPRRLPTAVLLADQSTFARSLIAGMQETDYFSMCCIIRRGKTRPGRCYVVATSSLSWRSRRVFRASSFGVISRPCSWKSMPPIRPRRATPSQPSTP